MHKLRHSIDPAKCLIKKHMERSRRKPLLTANHMSHLHEVVINDIGKVICGEVVGTLIEHLIVENRRIDGHLSTDKVVHLHIAVGLNLEAHHILLSGINQSLHLIGRQRERISHRRASVSVILEVGQLLTLRLKLFGGIKGIVSLSGIKQHLHVLAIDVATLRLLVGAIVATLAHTLVNADAEPCKSLIYIIFGSRHKAL